MRTRTMMTPIPDDNDEMIMITTPIPQLHNNQPDNKNDKDKDNKKDEDNDNTHS